DRPPRGGLRADRPLRRRLRRARADGVLRGFGSLTTSWAEKARVSKRSAPSPTKRGPGRRNPIHGRRRMFGVGVVSAGSGKVLPLGGRRGASRPEPPRGGAERDAALMAGISAGDPAALEALYERHAGAVFALCLRVLGDRSEAEEVLEDVFF